MKKFGKVSIVLLLLIFLLGGCGERVHCEDAPPSKETIMPVVPNLSLQPTPEPEINPTPVPEPVITDGAEKIGDNLLLIPNGLTESAVQQNIGRLGDNILAWSYHRGGQGSELLLSVIDSGDGETLYQRSFTGLEQANVQPLDDGLAVSDWADGRVFILDEKLEVRGGFELGQQGAVYLSPDCGTAYIFESERGIRLVHPGGDAQERYLLENVSGLYPSGGDEFTVSFSCISGENDMSLCGVLDLSAGEVRFCPFEGMFYGIERSGDTWFGSPYGEQNSCYVGADRYPRRFTLPAMSFGELLGDGRILVQTIGIEGGVELSLYSSEGVFISSCSIDMAAGGINGQPLWSEELCGYFLDISTPEGSDRLLFWDLSQPVNGTDLSLEPIPVQSTLGSSVSGELYELAEETGEKYGVEILIAELCDRDFAEFSTGQVFDEEYIRKAILCVDRALSSFPEGFFDKLCYSVFSSTEIHLVGPLHSGEGSGQGISFTDFVGAAVQENTENRIALDILRPELSIEQTLYHELSHLIEFRLVFDAANRGGSFSQEQWSALNPPEFRYFESRTDISEAQIYDGFEAWFIDSYSRVDPSEDRGRLFEYAMMGYDWAFQAAPGRTAKLEYYLNCILESFGALPQKLCGPQ